MVFFFVVNEDGIRLDAAIPRDNDRGNSAAHGVF
jgi:hypothetical protein